MQGDQVHYEVFVRRTAQSPWRLELASEDRAHALDSAEIFLTEEQVAAVRVTKEILDPETREFSSATILSKGAPATAARKAVRPASSETPCVSPQDLYNSHARETIGRLLDDWLRRYKATPFELLHRPALAEKLEAAGMDMQHAIQKIAVPESQTSGLPVHEVMRAYQKLTEATFERIIQTGRARRFPDLAQENLESVVARLAGHPDRLFLLGGAVAEFISSAESWREKVDRLLDLMETAPEAPQARALCQVVIEQPLGEILGSRAGLAELFGDTVKDLGGNLAGLARIAANQEIEALIAVDRNLANLMPVLDGAARRLSDFMSAGEFKLLGTVLAKRILAELGSPRRLRPGDAQGEIEILRSLAMVLTASAGRLLALDEIHEVFIQRSKALVAADFVTAYLAGAKDALGEAHALVRLCENVAGGANKRQAASWLASCVAGLRFETEMRARRGNAPPRLAALAELQWAVVRVNLPEIETREITGKIGQVGGQIEADSKIIAQILRSGAPLAAKVGALVKLANGEAAPHGPAADRARTELVRLVRAPANRTELSAEPELMDRLKGVLAAVPAAA